MKAAILSLFIIWFSDVSHYPVLIYCIIWFSEVSHCFRCTAAFTRV